MVDRVGVRSMREEDLPLIGGWLREPHVARWWRDPPEEELAAMRRHLSGGAGGAVGMLTVTEGDQAVGWAQWYWWDDDPEEALAAGVRAGEAGIDYAIGDPAAVGRGLGRQLVAALVREVHRDRPGAGILVVVDADNVASRAVLEGNRFQLVDVRPVATEPTQDPMAIYRLDSDSVRIATSSDVEVIAAMLDRFNREFDQPSPGPEVLAARMAELIESGETEVLLGGDGPAGLAVLRFRPSIWTSGSECYLAELYVDPEHRDHGLGRAIMREALDHARRRGADWMNIEVDEPDMAARHLYESLGFSNREGPGGPVMFVYERQL
jgi:ribosomal protein S18 acetylase RimI-like enzyme